MCYADFLEHAVRDVLRVPLTPDGGVERHLQLLLESPLQPGVPDTLIRFLRLYAGAQLPQKKAAVDLRLLKKVVKATGRACKIFELVCRLNS